MQSLRNGGRKETVQLPGDEMKETAQLPVEVKTGLARAKMVLLPADAKEDHLPVVARGGREDVRVVQAAGVRADRAGRGVVGLPEDR